MFDILESHIPGSYLGDYVQSMIYFKGYKPDHSMQRVVPDGSIYLVMELDDMPRHEIDNDTFQKKTERTIAWISGMHKDYISISALQDSEMFVIQFKGYGLYPFIRKDLMSLSNRVESPEEYFGDEAFKLRHAIKGLAGPAEKFEFAEQWLEGLFSGDHIPDESVVRIFMEIQKLRALELNSIATMIEEIGISHKHFTSIFKKFVGLTPKQFQRVIRFNEILKMVQEEKKVEWAQIALSCGYYDQAHFIKEFRNFCGINPSQFISNYKDYDGVNFFPLD